MADFLLTYRRPGRTTVHVVHGSHLDEQFGPWGKVRARRANVFRNLDGFDSVVFLTRRQRRDAVLRFGLHRNLAVIPNSRELPALDESTLTRPPTGGVMLCTLVKLKRADHGMQAVAVARSRSGSDLRLDIYGDGPLRPSLVERAARDHSHYVRLHGHQPNARARLADASFLLMTSQNEGFGLVLLEAMAAGCIPIAYNVPYGPAELITNRRNGFLVRDGDVQGLARAILRLQRMSPEQVEEMRRNARRAAERFTDAAVVPQWAALLKVAGKRKRATMG
jgi:poly(glycerol-phosphate) alpha-glucosyltransferase